MAKDSTNQYRQIWLIFFFLGIIMLNFPFLQIFNRLDTVFGIPVLVLYLFCGWPLSILVIYFFSRTITYDDNHLPRGDA